jgi:hypothetical protein
LYAQLVVLLQPRSQKAKDLMIGKGEDWRDRSHFKSAYALAWADWILFMPLFVAGIIGVLLGQVWGYALLAVAGAIQLYINIFLLSGHWLTTLTFGAISSIGVRPR